MAHPAFLLERPLLHMVEQVPYQCKSSQKGWTPLPSIDFKVKGVEGIKLTDAMNLCFDGPDDRDEKMFTDDRVGNSVLCRIDVRGFSDNNSRCHYTSTFD